MRARAELERYYIEALRYCNYQPEGYATTYSNSLNADNYKSLATNQPPCTKLIDVTEISELQKINDGWLYVAKTHNS